MVNNLRDLWLKSQFYNKGGSTLYQVNTRSDMLPTYEKTINLKSIKMDALKFVFFLANYQSGFFIVLKEPVDS